MPSKKQIVKELDKLANEFINIDKRKELVDSLNGEKTRWYQWVAGIKNVMKNIDKIEAAKLGALIMMVENSPKSDFHTDNLKKYLIDKSEYYKHYDFALEKKLAEKSYKTKSLWTSKILRLFISKSFLGIILVVLILGFIVWFYVDRESCLEFVNGVVQPFLKAIR